MIGAFVAFGVPARSASSRLLAYPRDLVLAPTLSGSPAISRFARRSAAANGRRRPGPP